MRRPGTLYRNVVSNFLPIHMSVKSLLKKVTGGDTLSTAAAKKTPAAKSRQAESAKPAKKGTAVATAVAIGLRLIMTEKAVSRHQYQQVVFRVRPEASKYTIAMAIREVYGVSPVSIRTLMMQPRARRRGKIMGSTAVWKKAYVKVTDLQPFNVAP